MAAPEMRAAGPTWCTTERDEPAPGLNLTGVFPQLPAVLQASRDLQKEETLHTLDVLQIESTVTRRRFVAFVGWGSFAAFWGSIVLATLRFLFPRILYEPSPLFQAGKPDDYQIGEVSTRFKEAQRVWIIRNTDGLYALVAICTHLGCTPIWHTTEERFKCPCHGSNFLRDGTNVAGPAPVPLYRAAINLDVMGTLLVDKSQRENQPGKRDKPPFFLSMPGSGRAAA
jgi:cytochrome b6-f complex iron-sulfur subunit